MKHLSLEVECTCQQTLPD